MNFNTEKEKLKQKEKLTLKQKILNIFSKFSLIVLIWMIINRSAASYAISPPDFSSPEPHQEFTQEWDYFSDQQEQYYRRNMRKNLEKLSLKDIEKIDQLVDSHVERLNYLMYKEGQKVPPQEQQIYKDCLDRIILGKSFIESDEHRKMLWEKGSLFNYLSQESSGISRLQSFITDAREIVQEKKIDGVDLDNYVDRDYLNNYSNDTSKSN